MAFSPGFSAVQGFIDAHQRAKQMEMAERQLDMQQKRDERLGKYYDSLTNQSNTWTQAARLGLDQERFDFEKSKWLFEKEKELGREAAGSQAFDPEIARDTISTTDADIKSSIPIWRKATSWLPGISDVNPKVAEQAITSAVQDYSRQFEGLHGIKPSEENVQAFVQYTTANSKYGKHARVNPADFIGGDDPYNRYGLPARSRFQEMFGPNSEELIGIVDQAVARWGPHFENDRNPEVRKQANAVFTGLMKYFNDIENAQMLGQTPPPIEEYIPKYLDPPSEKKAPPLTFPLGAKDKEFMLSSPRKISEIVNLPPSNSLMDDNTMSDEDFVRMFDDAMYKLNGRATF